MNFVYEMPAEMLKECDQPGKVERFEYDTFTYDEENKSMHKGAWVYLPYVYDDAKSYNVLYLLHGGNVSEDWWFKMFPETVTILDNMIAKGICDPCIIVTPTYYRGTEVDRQADFITEHFNIELRRDLIPAVEKHYATFSREELKKLDASNSQISQASTSGTQATQVSDAQSLTPWPENVKANDALVSLLTKTRDHRAFAGLSLGSMTTYRAAFYNNFNLFAWYGPFSGCCGPFGDHDKEVKRILETLKTGEAQGLPLRYMFCGNGDKDIAFAEHTDIMGKVLPQCPQIKPGENYDFYVIPGGVHDMKAWQLHLYHALQVFFR